MKKITPSALPAVTATIQAIDNQWTPGEILDDMLKNKLALDDVRAKREALVRQEFIRGLINLETVVANRANLINSDVVGGMYAPDGEERAAFLRLLDEGVLIPYLYREPSLELDGLEFDRYTANQRNWQRLCDDVRTPSVLRLDWDDDENLRQTDVKLARKFQQRVIETGSLDHRALAESFGLPADAEPVLADRLGLLGEACLRHYRTERTLVTRDVVYRAHVSHTDENTNVATGRYDGGQPLTAVVKQCVDLIYNTTLPDAIGRYALTPVGSPSRTILQEFIPRADSEGPNVGADDLLRLLRGAVFSITQEGLSLPSYGRLRLDDALEIRRYDAWRHYIDAQARVLNNPDAFGDPDGLDAIYRHYMDVAKGAAHRARERRLGGAGAAFRPACQYGVKLVLEVAGRQIVERVFGPDNEVVNIIRAAAAEYLSEKTAPVVARLVVGSVDALRGSPEQADFSTSVVFWQGRIEDAREQVRALKAKVREMGRALEPDGHAGRSDAPGLDEKG